MQPNELAQLLQEIKDRLATIEAALLEAIPPKPVSEIPLAIPVSLFNRETVSANTTLCRHLTFWHSNVDADCNSQKCCYCSTCNLKLPCWNLID